MSALGLSLLFSLLVMSDSLHPHGLQHTGLPCPSPSPGSCSNSCPSSQWCHTTISSSGERSLAGVCHKWPLLCWGKFPSSMPTLWNVSYHNGCWIWPKMFSASLMMMLIFQSANMMYHTDWFAHIKESLHLWNKSLLILVYNPFNALLDSVC